MTERCAAGHASTELDYCSVCGVPMNAAKSSASAPATASGGTAVCPVCGEARTSADTRFCEVCRYDFLSNKPGPAPRAPPPAQPKPASPAPTAPTATPRQVLVIQVDATLDTEPDAATPPPVGVADLRVPVAAAELLVGRRDDARDVHPEIPLHDPGLSRRHAKFVPQADGSLVLHDLASTNGTKLNGVEVEAGSRTTLHVGDEVTLGRWTRIKVSAQ